MIKIIREHCQGITNTKIFIEECVTFARCSDMLYIKSMCMSVYPKLFCKFQMPIIYLGDHSLKWVEEHQ